MFLTTFSVKKNSEFYWIWKKMKKVHSKAKSKKVCNMQIMQELPTNEPNFPFKHTQDFDQTTHVVLLSSLIISVYILITAIMFQNWWKKS